MRDTHYETAQAQSTVQFSSSTSTSFRDFCRWMKGREELTYRPVIRGFRTPTPYRGFMSVVNTAAYSYRPSGNAYYLAHGESSPVSDYGGVAFGMTGLYPDLRPGIPQNLVNRCETEALDKLNRGDIDLGVAVAEASQSFSLLLESSLAVIKAWNALRKFRLKDAMGYLKIPRIRARKLFKRLRKMTPSRQWLALQFGWKPLLNDIEGIISLLTKEWNLNAPILSCVRNVEHAAPLPAIGGDIEDVTGRGLDRVQTKFYYTIDSRTMYVLNNLGLVNPASIAWELVPFSFVLDWFIPVGTFIRTLTSTVGIDYLGGYTTRHREYDFTVTRTIASWRPVEGIPERYEVKSTCWDRTPLYVPPLPKLYVKLRFNQNKALSALALLDQLSQRRRVGL